MKNWKIGQRIAAGFAAVILTAVCLGLFAVSRVHVIGKNTDELGSNYFPSVMALSRVQTNIYHRLADLEQICASSDPQLIARLQQNLAELNTANEKDLAFYESTPFTPQEQAAYEEFKADRKAYVAEFDEVLKVGRSTDAASVAKAQAMFEQQLRPLFEKYEADVKGLVAANLKGANDGMASIQGSVTSTVYGVWIGILVAIGFAVPITIYIVRSITGPVSLAVAALDQVAQGDLTATIDFESKDEVGAMAAALNATVGKLRETMLEVMEAANATTTSSQELSSAAAAIASRTQEQAASLEETSASMEEITATVRQSADSAKQANQVASGSKDAALQGKDVVTSAVSAMEEINQASAKISDIISTIDEIAFQTNLLAVNAAVEAARAGEQGRGFAVVASEVRSLAGRSAAAAKEIKGLIQDSLRKVERGSELVNRSGDTLQGIVGAVTRVTDIMAEIAAASEEQSIGVEQVNTAVTQMDQVTQANSGQTEELSATAHSLAEQAARLMELVGAFRLGSDAAKRRATPAATVRPASAPARPSGGTVVRGGTRAVAKVKTTIHSGAGTGSGAGRNVAVLETSHGGEDSFEEF